MNKTKILLAVFMGVISLQVQGVTLELSNEPLQTKALPTTPSIMLLLDDSGSMGISYGGNDVFYSKGYNFKKVYRCPESTPIIEPDDSKFVSARMHKSTGIGYFDWGGKSYSVALTPIANTEYEVYSCSGLTSGLQYLNGGVWNTSSYSVTSYSFGAGELIRTSISHPSTTKNDCKAHYDSGNGVINASDNRGGTTSNSYTYRKLNDDFFLNKQVVKRPEEVACFDPKKKYNVYLKVDCPDGYEDCIASAATQDLIDHDANPSTPVAQAIPQQLDGNFLNWYFSNQSTQWIEDSYVKPTSNDDLNIEITSYATDFSDTTGYKSGTKITHERIDVAKDVAQILVGFYTNLNVGIATFRNGNGGEIDHQFAAIGDFNTNIAAGGTESAANSSNRTSLFNEIDTFVAGGSTPLAESMATVARYFAKRPDNTDEIYHSSFDTPDNLKNARNVFASSGVNVSVSSANPSAWEDSNTGAWCRRSYLVALTDGAPTADNGVTGTAVDWISDSDERNQTDPFFDGTDPSGNSNEYANDIAAAMFDIDFRPDINDIVGNERRHNVTTYTIGFGRQVASGPNGDFLRDIATRGGGEFFSATSGLELANAFKSIADSIVANNLSVGLVASSTVSELRTTNLTFKGGYETGLWSGNVTSFFVNKNGLFQNATIALDGKLAETGTASAITTNITPVWDTSRVMNEMYVLSGTGSSVNRSVDNRKIYTVNPSGSDFAAHPFTFANLSNFTATMQSDLGVNSDAEDLIDFIRGDVSHEEEAAATSADKKYRSRISGITKSGSSITSLTGGSILGSIVNSSPTYLSESPRPWNDQDYGVDGKRYSQFAKSNAYEEVNDGAPIEVDGVTVQPKEEIPVRPPMLYFGANDGMFHAVTVNGYNTADTDVAKRYPAGSELWAYVPSFIASSESEEGLHYLADPDYEHRFYLNMRPTVSEVFWDFDYSGSGAVGADWRSILVSGVGAGGKGIFALDITCPLPKHSSSPDYASDQCKSKDDVMFHKDHTAAEAKAAFEKFFLWEFDSNDDSNMGFSFSNPVIAKVNFDARLNRDPNGNGTGRWAAIVNNGYNSATGKAVLFILFLDGGLDGTWTKGQDYLVLHASDQGISTPATADTTSDANGLSSPITIDINNDGMIDKIYAGDLKGNMWAFDVSNKVTKATNPASTNISGTTKWNVRKLFTTRANQPITTAPRISKVDSALAPPNGVINPKDGVMVMFATGLYLQEGDVRTDHLQSVYAVLDDGVKSDMEFDSVDGTTRLFLQRYLLDYTIAGAGDSAGTSFNTRTVVDSAGFNGVNMGRTSTVLPPSPIPVDYNTQYGWYIDLYTGQLSDTGGTFSAAGGFTSSSGKLEGERVAYNPLLVNDLFVFTGIVPTNAECSGGLRGHVMAVSWFSGLPRSNAPVFDVDGNQILTDADLGFISVFSNFSLGESSYVGGRLFTTVGDDIRSTLFNEGGGTGDGDLSWEEIFPYGASK